MAAAQGFAHWSTLMSADDIIHQSTRLRIMAVLNTLERRDALEFTQLKAMIETTDGNLGAHIETLARAGYVDIEKLFVGRRPQTRVKATTIGRRAFRGHIAFLRKIIDQAEPTQRRK
jgi:DNA-binding MarR family transcriptional regulator